jgi:hypothetical protein
MEMAMVMQMESERAMEMAMAMQMGSERTTAMGMAMHMAMESGERWQRRCNKNR